jgi:hypothetical protein
MKFEVWHAEPPNFFEDFDRAKAMKDYTLVAEVEAKHIDEVFQLTNHIDSDWTKNEGVELAEGVSAARARSTSVGDVIVGPRAEGWSAMVAGIGFKFF